jgi:hypothetical protein
MTAADVFSAECNESILPIREMFVNVPELQSSPFKYLAKMITVDCKTYVDWKEVRAMEERP